MYMGSRVIVVSAAILLFLLLVALQVYGADFNVKTYGAKADGKTDDSEAINSAWKRACAADNPSKVVIAEGVYMVGPLAFEGPCKNKVTVQVEGTLKAPKDTKQLQKSRNGWVIYRNVDGLVVSGGGTFDGQGALAWSRNNCAKTGNCNSIANVAFVSVTNSRIQGITSRDSKFFHLTVLNCNNLTLKDIVIRAPETSLNTDGIHIGRSNGIHIVGAEIQTGDDCVSVGDGSQNVSIEDVTCGPGHGISIGSLGRYRDEQPVDGITVKHTIIRNTSNGVRIKTWPASPTGIASNMQFEDITMDNVSTPILIDQEYCPYGQCQAKIPSRVKISNVSFKRIHGTSATQLAVKLTCSHRIPCHNVTVEDINLTYNGKEGSSLAQCVNVEPKVAGKVFPSCSESS